MVLTFGKFSRKQTSTMLSNVPVTDHWIHQGSPVQNSQLSLGKEGRWVQGLTPIPELVSLEVGCTEHTSYYQSTNQVRKHR
jgi:hypothetical protein